jgi:aminoglycoside phosphotransferase family enzyme/predicted kinase
MLRRGGYRLRENASASLDRIARRSSSISEADQRETIAFLEALAGHGTPGGVERVDTHAAIVFLTGERAYKLKRAVRYSYLDFSTVARREAACRAELELNRRTAPDLYLGVRPIVRAAGGALAFDGAGTVVDWAIEMRRFDQDLLFDRMAARGELDDALAERLSAEIARFHAGAPPAPGHGGRAGLEAVAAGIEENLAAAHDVLPPERCAALGNRWRAEFLRVGELLDRRAREGYVRRCHGDLHLRNICLWHGRPTLFDCLEFSEELASTDVLYDLAFLLMDLEHRSLRRFANRVLNEYLDRAGDGSGIAALPLMLSLRAAIRAHTGVASARAQSHPERRAEALDEARQYLVLAERLLERPAPRLIAIGGLSGTGKSTLARGLAPRFGPAPGARLLHTDALRKRLFGAAKTDRLSPDRYEPGVSERVYRLQREAAAETLAAGYSVVVDGVFARPAERAAIAQSASRSGATFCGLWLTAPEEVLQARVAARRDDMSDATLDVLAQQLRLDTGAVEWDRVAAEGTQDETLARAAAFASAAAPFIGSSQ